MAISYLSVKFHSRSNGHKAVAGAAYRAGVKLYDERYDEKDMCGCSDDGKTICDYHFCSGCDQHKDDCEC